MCSWTRISSTDADKLHFKRKKGVLIHNRAVRVDDSRVLSVFHNEKKTYGNEEATGKSFSVYMYRKPTIPQAMRVRPVAGDTVTLLRLNDAGFSKAVGTYLNANERDANFWLFLIRN